MGRQKDDPKMANEAQEQINQLTDVGEEKEHGPEPTNWDYLNARLEVDGKWVTDSLAKDRRIALYGVQISLTMIDGKVMMDPVIPCLGPLAVLLQKHPKAVQFKFDKQKRNWRLL
jgi:hypothetical protein